MPNHLPPKNTPRHAPPTPRHDRTAQLTALGTGGLNALQRHLLLRHVARCPACRAERERIALLAAGLRALCAAPAPALPALPAGAVTANVSFSPPDRFWNGGKHFSLAKRVAVFAAVLLVSAGAVLTTLPGGPVRPTVAFARVEQAMDRVKTAAWNERLYYPDDKAGRKPSQGSNVWVRMDPTAQLTKSTPYDGAPLGTRFLTTPRGVLSYSPGEPYYLLFGDNFSAKAGGTSDAKKLREDFRRSLIFPRDPTEQGTDRSQDAPYKWRESTWKGDKTRRNGSEVLRFRRHSVRYRDDTAWWRKQKPQEYRETVYADPKTFLVVRRELQAGRSLTVSDGFRYNITPPLDSFEVAPPVGQTVLLSDWTRTGLYARLADADRRGAERAVRALTDARNNNDWESYSRLRDFGYVPQRNALRKFLRNRLPAKYRRKQTPPPPTSESVYRAQIRENFRRGTPYRSWRVESIGHVTYDSTYLYTRRDASDPFPPHTPPDTFDVRATLTAVTQAGKTVKKGAFFTVRKVGDAFRVAGVRFYQPPKPSFSTLSPYGTGARIARGGDGAEKTSNAAPKRAQ